MDFNTLFFRFVIICFKKHLSHKIYKDIFYIVL